MRLFAAHPFILHLLLPRDEVVEAGMIDMIALLQITLVQDLLFMEKLCPLMQHISNACSLSHL